MRLGSEFRVVLEVFQPLACRGKKRLNSGISGWISGEEAVSLLLRIALEWVIVSPGSTPLFLLSFPPENAL